MSETELKDVIRQIHDEVYKEAYIKGAQNFAYCIIDNIDEGFITHSSDIVDVFSQWRDEQNEQIPEVAN